MKLPQPVLQLMWEYDLDALQSCSGIPDAVLERVMVRGGWEEMVWLKKEIGLERIRSFLEKRGSRVLPPRELRFWCLAGGIDDSTADRWVAEARYRMESWRG